MNGPSYIAFAVAALAVGGVIILRRHEEQVKLFHYIETGERFGCDWGWASPAETGQSWLFSAPWVKNFRTGQITKYPLMG